MCSIASEKSSVASISSETSFSTSTPKMSNNPKLQKAILLYDAQKYQEAYNALSQLEIEGLKSEEFYFYMGRTTFELGMYSESIANYDLLLAKNPMHGRARLEKARAHLLLKEYDEAKKEFKTVLATPIPESVRKNIEAYLAKIDQSQQKNFFSGMAYYGHGVDSNVYNNTFLDTTQYGSLVLQNNTSEIKTEFNRFIFALEHTYRFSSIDNLAWKSSAMVYHNGYRDYTDQDIMLLSLSSGPEYIIQNYKMALPLTYDKINYGNKEYLRVYGIAPSLEVMLNNTSAMKATLRLNDKEYLQITDKDKDAGYLEFKLEYNQLLFSDNLLSLKGSASTENKKNGTRVDVSRTRYELGVSYLLPLNETLKSNVASGYARSNYLDSDAILGRRQDSNYYITAGLTQQLSKMVSIGANYMYSQNDSNINVYTYKKHVYMANIMIGF